MNWIKIYLIDGYWSEHTIYGRQVVLLFGLANTRRDSFHYMLNIITIPPVRAFQITHYIVWMFAVLQSCARFFYRSPQCSLSPGLRGVGGFSCQGGFFSRPTKARQHCRSQLRVCPLQKMRENASPSKRPEAMPSQTSSASPQVHKQHAGCKQ